jgi:hypothetical protein
LGEDGGLTPWVGERPYHPSVVGYVIFWKKKGFKLFI